MKVRNSKTALALLLVHDDHGRLHGHVVRREEDFHSLSGNLLIWLRQPTGTEAALGQSRLKTFAESLVMKTC